jgi:hypothetical protein
VRLAGPDFDPDDPDDEDYFPDQDERVEFRASDHLPGLEREDVAVGHRGVQTRGMRRRLGTHDWDDEGARQIEDEDQEIVFLGARTRETQHFPGEVIARGPEDEDREVVFIGSRTRGMRQYRDQVGAQVTNLDDDTQSEEAEIDVSDIPSTDNMHIMSI